MENCIDRVGLTSGYLKLKRKGGNCIGRAGLTSGYLKLKGRGWGGELYLGEGGRCPTLLKAPSLQIVVVYSITSQYKRVLYRADRCLNIIILSLQYF